MYRVLNNGSLPRFLKSHRCLLSDRLLQISNNILYRFDTDG